MEKLKMKKISIYLFILAIITMVIGLILIGVSKDGFTYLKYLDVGGVLQVSGFEKESLSKATNLPTLQAGAVFAAILTPIFFISSVLMGACYFFKKE